MKNKQHQPARASTNCSWNAARVWSPCPTAVAHPCEASALAGAVRRGPKGLIVPILVGPSKDIGCYCEGSGGSLLTDWRSLTLRTAALRQREPSHSSAKAAPKYL
jgi:hypothetical protein